MLEVLLCLKDKISLEELKAKFNTNGFDVQIQSLPVCRYAPLNRQQYTAWNSLWPLIYREDTRLDPKFTTTDMDTIETHMRAILSSSTVVCRIVDPTTNNILSEQIDQRDKHPLHHAIICCVNQVAEAEMERHGGLGRTKRTLEMTEDEEPKKTAYLCTGYDVYITHEPCAM